VFGASRLAGDSTFHLSDNVILLHFAQDAARLRRAVTVLKTRASRHDPHVREFDIAPDGIVLGEPLSCSR
jgi:circadian clock protein KaiC